VGVDGRSSICQIFGCFRHCGRCSMGRFEGWLGAAGLRSASRGLRWVSIGSVASWWVELAACSLVLFVTVAARWVGLRAGWALRCRRGWRSMVCFGV
jgi:hypothetical protein